MKIFVLIIQLIFFSISLPAENLQTVDPRSHDTDTQLVHEKLQKISGRIIQVVKNKEKIIVANVCSATLLNENTIITSAHCFKRNYFLTGIDSIKKAAEKLMTQESFYFDIPDVSSQGLAQEISNLSEFEELSIEKKHENHLDLILARIPKLEDIQLLKEYEANMPLQMNLYNPKTEKQKKILEEKMKSATWNYLGNVYDLAVAKINKNLPSQEIEIRKINPLNSVVYVSGYYGGNLFEPLQVYKCISSQEVVSHLLPRAAFESFITMMHYKDSLIISACDGAIAQGQSGGPQVQYQNGKLYLVGVNSGLIYGTDNHIISPRVESIIKKFTF